MRDEEAAYTALSILKQPHSPSPYHNSYHNYGCRAWYHMIHSFMKSLQFRVFPVRDNTWWYSKSSMRIIRIPPSPPNIINMVKTASKIEVGGMYGDFGADFSFRKIATLQMLWPEWLAVQTKSGGGGSGGGDTPPSTRLSKMFFDSLKPPLRWFLFWLGVWNNRTHIVSLRTIRGRPWPCRRHHPAGNAESIPEGDTIPGSFL